MGELTRARPGTACRLAEDVNGTMPRPLEAEVCESREATANVDREGSVVDAHPRPGCGGIVVDFPPWIKLIDDSSLRLPPFPIADDAVIGRGDYAMLRGAGDFPISKVSILTFFNFQSFKLPN